MALQQISFPFGDEELPERPKDEDTKHVPRTRKGPDELPLVQAALGADWTASPEEQAFPEGRAFPDEQTFPEDQISHVEQISHEEQTTAGPELTNTPTEPLTPSEASPQPEPTNIPRISLAQARASIYYEEEVEEPIHQVLPEEAVPDPVVHDAVLHDAVLPEVEVAEPAEASLLEGPTVEVPLAEAPSTETEAPAAEAEDVPEEPIIASKEKTPKVKAPKTLPPAPGAETQLWPEEEEEQVKDSNSSLWPEEGAGRAASSPKKIKIQKGGRGRKSMKELAASVDLVEIPDDDILFQKQYYSIGEVAAMFKVNTSLIRFWETEFTEIRPRKNKKGDRSFSPMDIKIIQLIHFLLRQKKLTIEGAKEYLKAHNKDGNAKLEMIRSMEKIKAFLLELKARL